MAFGNLPGIGSPPSDMRTAIEELYRVVEIHQGVLDQINRSFGTVLHTEPVRPRECAVAFADGTDWDPGAGMGLYQYQGGAWVKL